MAPNWYLSELGYLFWYQTHLQIMSIKFVSHV
jgi:hypothetical protein